MRTQTSLGGASIQLTNLPLSVMDVMHFFCACEAPGDLLFTGAHPSLGNSPCSGLTPLLD